MNSIDRLSAQDAVRTSVQRTGATHSSGVQPAQGQQLSTSIAPLAPSDWARWLAVSFSTVKNASDLRDERVADIRQRLDAGTYNVPARRLARKMLDVSQS